MSAAEKEAQTEPKGGGSSSQAGAEDEAFDESSIEALDWSEVEEEERRREEAEQATLSTSMMEQTLSFSLLQTMEEEVGNEGEGEEQEKRKKKEEEIQSWAEGVSKETQKVRRRKKAKDASEMVTSVMSTETSEGGDLLSQVPVLDDGPIWDRGPRSYRFQENRRINQKLTFAVLFALVLAIGLGLGNLVAYNECELEHKAVPQNKPHLEPAIATPPSKEKKTTPPPPPPPSKPDIQVDKAQYMMEMETLSKIVKTLDNLQQRIDNFENKSRQLGGVVMLKDDESLDPPASRAERAKQEFRAVLEEIVNALPEEDNQALFPSTTNKPMEEEEEDTFVLDLIDGIEETTSDYLRRQDEMAYLEELEKLGAGDKLEQDPSDVLSIDATIRVFKRAVSDFISREREELRDKKILGLAPERRAEDYTSEERVELRSKYERFMKEFPLKDEVAVERERLKFQNTEEKEELGMEASGIGNEGENLEAEIEGFFKLKRFQEDEKKEEELDFQNFLIPKRDEDEDAFVEEEPFSFTSPEPKKEKEEPSPSPKSFQREEQKQKGKRKKRESSSSSDEEKKKWKKQEKEDKKKGKGKRGDKKNSNSHYEDNSNKERKIKFKAYNLNTDFDLEGEDDDDDDHKRGRKRTGHYDSSSFHHPSSAEKREREADWLLQRDRMREEFRRDGKKVKGHSKKAGGGNWQLERDRRREKVRAKEDGIRNFAH